MVGAYSLSFHLLGEHAKFNKRSQTTTLFPSAFLHGLWASKDWSHLLRSRDFQAHSYRVPSPTGSALFWFENRGRISDQLQRKLGDTGPAQATVAQAPPPVPIGLFNSRLRQWAEATARHLKTQRLGAADSARSLRSRVAKRSRRRQVPLVRSAMSTPVVLRDLQLPPSQRAQSAFRGEGCGGGIGASRRGELGRPGWGVGGSGSRVRTLGPQTRWHRGWWYETPNGSPGPAPLHS